MEMEEEAGGVTIPADAPMHATPGDLGTPTRISSRDVYHGTPGTYQLKAEPSTPAKIPLTAEVPKTSDPTESETPLNFDDQCYLMSYWKDFAEKHQRDFFHNPGKYITLLDAQHPEKIPGLLQGTMNGFGLWKNLTPEIQSLLVPQIRLFKVYPRLKNNAQTLNKYVTRELLFPHADIGEEISTSGVKSFSIKYEGTNPATVDRWITANLVLYYANIDEFFRIRPGGVRHADLINPRRLVKSGAPQDGSEERVDVNQRQEEFIRGTFGSSFWIRAELGWAIPTKIALKEVLPPKHKTLAKKYLNQIHDASVGLMLSYARHTFDVKKDGGVEISIDFAAYHEAVFSCMEFDIFNPDVRRAQIATTVAGKQAVLDKKTNLFEILKTEILARSTNGNSDADACATDFMNGIGLGAACRRKRIVYSKNCGRNLWPLGHETLFNKIFPSAPAVAAMGAPEHDIGPRRWFDAEVVQETKVGPRTTGGVQMHGNPQVVHETGAVGAVEYKSIWANDIKLMARQHALSTDNLIKAKNALAADLSTTPEQLKNILKARFYLSSYKGIISKLYNSSRIYFVDLTLGDTDRWRARVDGLTATTATSTAGKTPSSTSSPPAPAATILTAPPFSVPHSSACDKFKNYTPQVNTICSIGKCLLADPASDEFARVARQKSISIRRINFIYFADLIDVAIELLVENSREKKEFLETTRVFLGNAILRNFDSNGRVTRHSVNIGDLPIAMKDYNTWFQKKVIDKSARVWTLQTFILDCIKDLIFAVLGETCLGGVKQFGAPSLVYMSSYARKDGLDPLPREHRRLVFTDKKMAEMAKATNYSMRLDTPKFFSPSPKKKIIHYMYIYINSRSVGSLYDELKPNQGLDEKEGIFWFDMGVAAGFLKDLKFKKKSFEQLRTVRIVQASEGSLDFIYDPYDADLTLYGHAYFKPGTFIYINPALPSSYGSSNEKWMGKLGLGGYYLILNVEHIIENGKFETLLKASFHDRSKRPHQGADAVKHEVKKMAKGEIIIETASGTFDIADLGKDTVYDTGEEEKDAVGE